ncbi:MAG: DsbA family protein [Paracoccaceae bacterium]
MNRRKWLILAGLGTVAGSWQMFGVRKPSLQMAPLRGVPGWQFASLGGVTGVSGADFMTLGLQEGPPALLAADLYDVVHRDARAGAVPVAVFTDYFCPYCRGLIGRLAARRSAPKIAITWHELPLLGSASELVAHAAEAAALQDGYAAYYAALLKAGFKPVPQWLVSVADHAGLNAAQFAKDMDGSAVAARLENSARAAKTLGFIGTPGIAIGQSAVLGALDAPVMEELFMQSPVT